jgi:8-oxo-dGTP diphosphatase
MDGDGFVECACGRRHWGRHGAAGLLLVTDRGEVLVQHRAERSHEGGTWALPGGARTSAEAAHEAALREAAEEAGITAKDVRLAHSWIEDHGTWSYTTVVGHVSEPLDAHPVSWESTELRWVAQEDVTALELHPAFAAAWPILREQAARRLVLVVDAANVVGSRPDGWWRDRFGATERLRDKLARLATAGVLAEIVELPGVAWWPDVRLVVEGAARGVPSIPGIDVRTAARDGDAMIEQVVTEAVTARPDDHVVAVTADRELRRRVNAAGGTAIGPSTLRHATE